MKKTLEEQVKDAVFDLYGDENLHQVLWVPNEVAEVIKLLIERGYLKHNEE